MKFIKSFFALLGVHLLMCILPLLLSPILNGDPRFTINQPKSATQIVVYALYFVAFFVVYFISGRKAGEDKQGYVATAIASVIIAALGVLVYYLVFVGGSKNILLMFFAMPQLMVSRALSNKFIGNKIISTIFMVMPMIVMWIGMASNVVKLKKKKRSEQG